MLGWPRLLVRRGVLTCGHRRWRRTASAAPIAAYVAAAALGLRRVAQDGLHLVRRACRLCGAADESVYHIALACGDARLSAVQADAATATRQLLLEAWRDGREVLLRADEAPPPVGAANVAALERFLSGDAASTADAAECAILTYWPLLGVPWPAWAAAPHHRAIRALGGLFDALNVQPRWLRRWAANWLGRSEVTLQALGKAWGDAVAGLPAAATPAGGHANSSSDANAGAAAVAKGGAAAD